MHQRLVASNFVFELRFYLLLGALFWFTARATASQTDANDLLTMAERNDRSSPADYRQMSAFVDRLTAKYPLAKRVEIKTDRGGQTLPLLVVSDPAVSTPEEASGQIKRGKCVVLVYGHTAAGSDDAPDVVLALARDVLSSPRESCLTNLILLFAPVASAPGVTDREQVTTVSPGRAASLNSEVPSDYVTLEKPETRTLVRVLNRWDPSLVVELRPMTNDTGRHIVVAKGPRRLAGDQEMAGFVRKTMLGKLAATFPSRAKVVGASINSAGSDRQQAKSTRGPGLDFADYLELRGRLGLSLEYSPGELRREGLPCLRDCLHACLDFAADNHAEIRKMIDRIDETATRKIPAAVVAPATPSKKTKVKSHTQAQSQAHARDEKSAAMETKQPSIASTDVPYGYLLPATLGRTVEVLQRQGIEVEEFREDIELDLEAFRIAKVKPVQGETGGRRLFKFRAKQHATSRKLPAGTVLVRTGQRLRSLVSFLLEPQSMGGFAGQGLFGEHLKRNDELPILRLPQPTPITRAQVRPLAEDREINKSITFEAVYESERAPDFSGSPAGGIHWLEDGKHFLQTKEGELRKVDALSGRSSIYLDKTAIAKALGQIPSIGEKAARDLANQAASNLDKNGAAAWFNYQNDLYYARLDGTSACRLTSTPQPEELAGFSPDGRFVAFVRANDLFVVDVEIRTERALTTGGGERLLNGKADWVYYEEVFNRNHRAYWWSPDSRRIAFFQTDNSPVKNYLLLNDLPADQVVERTPYPRPGEPNPRVRLASVTVGGGAPVFPDFSQYDTESHLVTGVGWWPDSSAVYCFVQDRAQTWLDVCSVPPGGGKPTRLFRDKTKAWIEAPAEPAFFKDGSFLVTSTRNGWQHLYRYDKNGKLIAALTSGDWEVRKLHLLDETNRWIYFTATKDSLIAENLYRARLDGTGLTRLTLEPGNHRIDISPTGGHFIDNWSNRSTPAKVALRRTDGALVRMLDTNPVYRREEYRFGENHRFQIKTADGFLMEAAWVKPPDFDAQKKYPVWFTTYGGPHMPSITDSWGGGALWDQALARAGVVVFHLDPRSASGKGDQSAWTAYRQLGVQELKDIVEGIQWLKRQPWVDGRRIGMSGYSYGGFMTAYAMTHCDLFAAGIAGAPPTDWRDYDSIYTERYMSTPQDNPDGYESTSVVKAAKNLHGKLLIIHGTIDDNVHPANSVKFIQALQEARKPFEMMFYPGFRHGISGKHFQRQQYDFILRTVGGK